MYRLIIATVIGISLLGCEADQDTRLQESIDSTSATALFSPSNSVIPFPSNLLFAGSSDGTLNIPVADPTNISDPKVAMNSLDGFSTNTPFSTTFGSPIDETTITNGPGVPVNVRVFSAVIDDYHINPSLPPNPPPTFAVASIASELIYGVDFVATVSDKTTLVILPLRPLSAKSGYVVVITNGLKNTTGDSFLPDTTYAIVKETSSLIENGVSRLPALATLPIEDLQKLEGLRLLTNATEVRIVGFDNTNGGNLTRENIILSWSFSTQSIDDVLTSEKAEIPDPPAVGAFRQISTPIPNVDVYAGTIDIPYYLDSTYPLRSIWKDANGEILSLANQKNPVPTQTLSIPILITVPNDPSLATYNEASIPVVIYQHGITRARTDGLALAGSLGEIGYAMVAIDLPLHGITDINDPFYDEANERTFNLDLINNDTKAPGNDGIFDPSGQHFINLASLQTSRDNIRQSIMDLFSVVKAINIIDVNGGGVDFNSNKISFVGHSLGGIVGIPFLAMETQVNSSVIAMAGGGIAKILDGSATYGAQISNGLATKGVLKGTADYESFMIAAQTVLDSADPLNYGKEFVTNHNVLFFEIVGDGLTAGSPSDLVIPNRVPDVNNEAIKITKTKGAPLAGTEPLIGPAVMNLNQTEASITLAGGLDISIKFTGGHHGSLLTSVNTTDYLSVTNSDTVYNEMHENIKTFLDSNGTEVVITNVNVIQSP